MTKHQLAQTAVSLDALDEAERIDQEARRSARETVRARRNASPAPHNMNGNNDKRTLLDDDPETMEEGVRGRATYLVVETMLAGPCTRDDILDKMRKEFPDKEDTVLKNTLGSLMHSLPIKRKWTVEKARDKDDKRKVIFTVTNKGIDSDEEKEARAEGRRRAHSREGAHANI